MKISNMLAGKGMPPNIGIPRGQLLCIAGFNVYVGGWANGCKPEPDDWWTNHYTPRLKELLADLPKGATVSLNLEACPSEEWSLTQSDVRNELAMFKTGQRAKWIKSVRPDLVLDWNTSPITVNTTPWMFPPLTPADYARVRLINDLAKKYVLPNVDQVSSQAYPERGPDWRNNWRLWMRWITTVMPTMGKPVAIMVNPQWPGDTGYIDGQDLTYMLDDLRSYGCPVLLWGTWANDPASAAALKRWVEAGTK